MPPQIRELLASIDRLTVDSVSQAPFVIDRGDPRGPRYFFDRATAEGFTLLPERRGRSITAIIETDSLSGASDWSSVPAARPIEVDDIVARDAPLFSLLRRLEHRPLLLCLGRDGIDGVVTVYDLNQPAAHMFTLGLALMIEAEVAAAISRSIGEQRAIERHVVATLGAKNNQIKRWQGAVGAGEQVDIFNYLTFSEKMRCLTDRALEGLADAAKTESGTLKRQLREIQHLRNHIAHYSTLELADYRTVVQRMRAAYTIARRLGRSQS